MIVKKQAKEEKKKQQEKGKKPKSLGEIIKKKMNHVILGEEEDKCITAKEI